MSKVAVQRAEHQGHIVALEYGMRIVMLRHGDIERTIRCQIIGGLITLEAYGTYDASKGILEDMISRTLGWQVDLAEIQDHLGYVTESGPGWHGDADLADQLLHRLEGKEIA